MSLSFTAALLSFHPLNELLVLLSLNYTHENDCIVAVLTFYWGLLTLYQQLFAVTYICSPFSV
ncbi:hypothetical protein AMS58_15185 [Pseudoalteromonas porphyrae]|nr:hypothetical protein AMS58_15185 [Pseudoalteromonas porphyrae]